MVNATDRKLVTKYKSVGWYYSNTVGWRQGSPDNAWENVANAIAFYILADANQRSQLPQDVIDFMQNEALPMLQGTNTP